MSRRLTMARDPFGAIFGAGSGPALELRQRVEAALDHSPLRHRNYFQPPEQAGLHPSWLCTDCGRRILGPRPDGDPVPLRDETGRMYALAQNTYTGALPGYCELRLFLDPDGNHETAVCRDCAQRPWTRAQLEALYCADIEQYALQGVKDGVSSDKLQGLLAYLFARTPTGGYVILERPGGGR